jgi:hypothetical protein
VQKLEKFTKNLNQYGRLPGFNPALQTIVVVVVVVAAAVICK